MKKELLDFAQGTLEQAKEKIRCGFEFEFHALDGLTSNDTARSCGCCGETGVDHVALREASSEAFSNESLADLLDGSDSPETQLIIALHNCGLGIGAISDNKVFDRLNRILDRVERDWRDQWEVDNEEDYLIDGSDYNDLISLPGYVEIGEDGSVRGGEIRTIGPRTVAEFLHAAEKVSKGDFKVDHGCSFHVHLSVPGVQHVYGGHLQADIYSYLLSQWHRLPKPVQKRLVHEDGGMRWARFKLSNESKYVAVFKHGQNTWEFRLFGAITEFEDMRTCLDLAIEAMYHAYRVKAGLEQSLNQRATLSEIGYVLSFCYELKRPDLFHVMLKNYDETANCFSNQIMPYSKFVQLMELRSADFANAVGA